MWLRGTSQPRSSRSSLICEPFRVVRCVQISTNCPEVIIPDCRQNSKVWSHLISFPMLFENQLKVEVRLAGELNRS